MSVRHTRNADVPEFKAEKHDKNIFRLYMNGEATIWLYGRSKGQTRKAFAILSSKDTNYRSRGSENSEDEAQAKCIEHFYHWGKDKAVSKKPAKAVEPKRKSVKIEPSYGGRKMSAKQAKLERDARKQLPEFAWDEKPLEGLQNFMPAREPEVPFLPSPKSYEMVKDTSLASGFHKWTLHVDGVATSFVFFFEMPK
jgi:hypothetical protein